MRILPDFFQAELERPTVLTIGSFDGVHLGHRKLIRAVVERARTRGAASAVVTLYPHPKIVLGREPGLLLITTLEERLERLAGLGLDTTVILPFTAEASHVTAAEFVDALVKRLGMVEILCTEDLGFGFKRQGNVPYLRERGRAEGFEVTVIEPEIQGGAKISSSRLRKLIAEGQVGTAAHLLGHSVEVRGKVVHGDRRGRELGFPTANLELPAIKLFPANGVYATRVRLGEEWFGGATSIGVRPVFTDSARRLVEVYIFDFDREIYGEELEAHFVARLRDEWNFPSVDALVTQMRRDCETARVILHSEPLGNEAGM